MRCDPAMTARDRCSCVCVLAGTLAATAARIAAQVPGELTGHITDARTARPIESVHVEIVGRPEAVQSGVDGSFALRGLEPRAYTLRARAVGYAVRDVDVEVTNGRTTIADIALEPSAVAMAPVAITARRDTASSASTTFDRQAVEASGKRDLGELLETTPGVVITQAGGPGSASYASIRGSEAADVLVLLDGVPLNSPITGEADLSLVPLENVERVVVLTGAQSARYGDRALGGVIDIQTRRPARDVSVLLRTGAWGEDNASVSVGDGGPVGSMRGGATLTGDYRTLQGDFPYAVPAVRGGGTALRVNSGVTSGQASGALSLDDSTRSLAVRGSWEDLSRGLAGSIVQPSTTGHETDLRADAGTTASWRHGIVAWTASGAFTDDRATFTDPSPPFGTAYYDTVAASVLTASTIFAVGGVARSASVGGEARAMDVTSTTLTPTAPHWQDLFGAFGELRGSHAFDAATHFDINANTRVDESSLIAGATVSPRVEAALSRGILVGSGSLGAAYAAPTLADEFFQEGVLVQPNLNLRPERTRDDLEGRLAMHAAALGPVRLSAEGAVYRANIDGMILWLPDYRFVWSPSNYNVHRSGWELTGTSSLPTIDVDVTAGLNNTDVTYAGPVLTGQVAYRPRTTANTTVGAGPRIARIEITNQYVGERRTTPGSSLNVLTPYWRTDARVTSSRGWGPWSVDATLAMDNVFDHPAAMLVDYPFPGRSWSIALRLRRGHGPDPL
jgi:vitamin B12 transporter